MLRNLGRIAHKRSRATALNFRPYTHSSSRVSGLSSAALASSTHSRGIPLTKYGADDAQLPSLFDKPSHESWNQASEPAGLFGNSDLSRPSDFILLAHRTQKYTKRLVDRIASYSESGSGSSEDLSTLVGLVDRLSDALCSVIDTAEFVRNSHPDPRWVTAANDAYESLCSWMNELNTHVGLYKVAYILPMCYSCKIDTIGFM